jgi:hypothetical protein
MIKKGVFFGVKNLRFLKVLLMIYQKKWINYLEKYHGIKILLSFE